MIAAFSTISFFCITQTAETWMICIPLLLFPVMYAEIHYKPYRLPSRYFRREPEIIFDTPFRIKQNAPLPVFLIIKDAHRYPVTIRRITVSLYNASGSPITEKEIDVSAIVNSPLYGKTIFLKQSVEMRGNTWCRVEGIVETGGEERRILQDNYAGLNPDPFEIYFSTSEVKTDKNFYWGDLHVHSNYTADAVEFGAPLRITRDAAEATGLNFAGITDHSYDFNNSTDSWDHSKDSVVNWNASRSEIKALNDEHSGNPLLIPGEEVSIKNGSGRNVHLLVLNNPTFIAGRGDSGEHLFRLNASHQLRHLEKYLDDQSLSVSAHPQQHPPFLQKVFLNRGIWNRTGMRTETLHGFQILNGQFNTDFESGKKIWIEQLLHGHRKFIIAGNDAHGNFNSFRQIKYPLLRMHRNRKQIFGRCKTGVWTHGQFSVESIMNALKEGRAIISDGPFCSIGLFTENGQEYRIGDDCSASTFSMRCSAESSEEFGSIRTVCLYLGNLKSRTETLFRIWNFRRSAPVFHWTRSISLRNEFTASVPHGYFRMELKTGNLQRAGRCLTNPVWFNP